MHLYIKNVIQEGKNLVFARYAGHLYQCDYFYVAP